MKKVFQLDKKSNKRFAQQKHYHEQKRYARWRRKFRPSIHMINNKHVPTISPIIKILANNTKPFDIKKNKITITIPTSFSILDNPSQAISFVQRLAASCLDEKNIKEIYIDHSKLVTFDLSANAILDTVITELKSLKKRRNRRKALICRGKFPKNENVERFIKAIGIIKHLDISKHAPKREEADKLEVFDERLSMLHSPENIAAKSSKRDRTIASFIEHTNKCLAKVNKQLTLTGKRNLSTYLGEVLGNAEEHAGMIDWTLQGYLDTHLDEPIYEISIFNFGKSISKTLEELDSNHYTKIQIKEYIEAHKKKKLFSDAWNLENLYTVVALQRNVSSKNTSELTTRGQGTMELLKFFQSIYSSNLFENHKTNMAIISGGTYINFDFSHVSKLGNPLNTIAFNEQNDLYCRPDEKYVKNLKEGVSFPGTIIALRFPLITSQLVDENGNENNGN